MEINADFTKPALVHAASQPWVPSPMPGVERRMLDRLGEEVARATSIVRYAPDSAFSPHTHGGGEEFVVLEGVFEDEYGAFPAGTYVRNPPGSRHTPGSTKGCTIFVKLWQFAPDDGLQFHRNMRDELEGVSQDLSVALLHQDEEERVTYSEVQPGGHFDVEATGGMEMLVLNGLLSDEAQTLVRHSWLRLPPGSHYRGIAGPDGASVWMKTGHLETVRQPPQS